MCIVLTCRLEFSGRCQCRCLARCVCVCVCECVCVCVCPQSSIIVGISSRKHRCRMPIFSTLCAHMDVRTRYHSLSLRTLLTASVEN